ncbi:MULTISPECIES: MerR family transcriptional regulator [unclassified Leptolyngbya]|uniref:MerR family transcriptional regulator n=1 Tax=unclassified Leptolyngbya TaxID=2650499 RepID=UPI0016896586|nr:MULTISPECIES: MerR family transcriptional regulator [unclassified Leptolyngbya]MBD1913655.1 MerR family transcriptional regulator [Leptolyngbya sp. FACHB-8]MBD2158253.1 MerR family transcriptional regulator [Leptolyngbya sp. FACHB-16]
MRTLQQVAQLDPHWSLEELVQIANELLPQFLPEEKAHTRVREEVTPRLVRHYTSQGMLDEPLKEGREARYTYRHLLQVLLVRRLLTEGYGASVIDTLARSKPDPDLEALLQGGAQLTVTPANPALAFLQQIQQRQPDAARQAPFSPPIVSPPPIPSPSPSTTQWTRLEVLPGLELHVRSDFTLPTTSQEQQNLLQHILRILTSLASSKRRSSRS